MPPNGLMIALLSSIGVGGLAWVFLYPLLSGEKVAAQRKDSLTRNEPTQRKSAPRSGQKSRREQVEDTLKELDARNRKRNSPPLTVKISQAGLDWSKQRLFGTFGVVALVLAALAMVLGGGLLAALGIGFAGALGLPFWFLNYMKKRRENQFLNAFPDSIDVLTRGIKAGLPLLDSMKVIVNDAPEPVRSEFRAIVETQAIGIPLGDACGRLYERVPLAEANFFAIVISIQQRSGGNLSEALANLSKVLRDRKKMKAKIKAISTEAKASAAIIACLPPAVMLLVYITSPDYISLLWTHPIGRVMLFGCVCWMSMGVMVMKKMINFDF
jgi:tight adherence protein B